MGKYQCVCDMTIKRRSDMDRHVAHVHFGEGYVECGKCGEKLANSSYARKTHAANVCGKQKPHACASCGKRFADPSAAKKCSKTEKCSGTPHNTTRAGRTVPAVAASQEEDNSEEAVTNASFLPLESYRAPHTTANAQQSVLAASAFSMAVNEDELRSSGSSSPFECSGVSQAPFTHPTSLSTAWTFPTEANRDVAAPSGPWHQLGPSGAFLTPPNDVNPHTTSYPSPQENFGMQASYAFQPQAVNYDGTTQTGFSTHQPLQAGLGLQGWNSETLAQQADVSGQMMVVGNPPEPSSYSFVNGVDEAPQDVLSWEPLELFLNEQLNNNDGNPVTPFRPVANDEAAIDPQLFELEMSQPMLSDNWLAELDSI